MSGLVPPVPEVPTEVPSDLEEGTASAAEVQSSSGLAATPTASAASAPVVATALPSPSAEPEALAKKQRRVLDKACRYLPRQCPPWPGS